MRLPILVVFGVFMLAGVGVLAGACGGAGEGAGATVTVTVSDPITVTVETPAEEPIVEETVEATDAIVEEAVTDEVEASAAEIAVDGSGFTQDGDSATYGLRLVNTSATDDALGVTLTVNLLAKDGGILTSDSHLINVIPAAHFFVVGYETSVAKGDKIADIETIIDIDESAPAEYPLPKVSRLRATPNQYFGYEFRGQVENNLDRPLSDFGSIYVIFSDKNKRILGGLETFLDAPLPPGRKAAFSSILLSVEIDEQIGLIEGSMDNEVSE